MIPKGFRFGAAHCGLKNRRNDVGIIVCDGPAQAAGLFTTNLVRAACVEYSAKMVDGPIRALVVNSGNANCCTGEQGFKDCLRTAEITADVVGCHPAQVLVASTGIIGRPMDMGKLERGIHMAVDALCSDPKPFMESILTTDLVEKFAQKTFSGGSIYGLAKGSGMIAPNMATMLAFLVTDIPLSKAELDMTLRQACDRSFHCLTVDGDTSTNDMALLLSSGLADGACQPREFQAAVDEVCESLTRQIARDGEGATKLIEVFVQGTADPARIARTIAESPLVKTAMFGCDPNWGRILAAAGRAGVSFDPLKTRLLIRASGKSFVLYEDGLPGQFDESEVSTALKADSVEIHVLAAEGRSAKVYTCDYGYGYVRINAEYHT